MERRQVSRKTGPATKVYNSRPAKKNTCASTNGLLATVNLWRPTSQPLQYVATEKGAQIVARVFLAGIIQGSMLGNDTHGQDYRSRLKQILTTALPGVEVFCPVEDHPDSVGYDIDRARDVFFGHVDIARNSELVVAYLPSASMGTAVEIWEAHRAGQPIVAITPMTTNWVVRLLCDVVVSDLEDFAHACRDGRIAALFERVSA
jgi:hypothetical protein